MAVRDDEVVSAGGRAPLVGWLMMQPDRDAISSIFLLDLKLQYSAGHLPDPCKPRPESRLPRGD